MLLACKHTLHVPLGDADCYIGGKVGKLSRCLFQQPAEPSGKSGIVKGARFPGASELLQKSGAGRRIRGRRLRHRQTSRGRFSHGHSMDGGCNTTRLFAMMRK